MHNDPAVDEVQVPERRQYEAPKLTEIGSVAQLTQGPQVAPNGITPPPPSNPPTGTQIFFLGDNA